MRVAKRTRRDSPRQPTASGLAVDWQGGPVIDPTANVISLVDASILRLDDLRDAEALRVDMLRSATSAHAEAMRTLEARRVDEQAAIRAYYEDLLRTKEASRLDAIRQVDREDVSKTAAAAQTAIATLANATTTMAETLRTQVANTAAAAESRQATYAGDVNKRLSALELSSSEGKGKSQLSDPMMQEVMMELRKLSADRDRDMGRDTGLEAARQQANALRTVQVAVVLGVLTSIISVAVQLLRAK
jgi:hypothetical protein